DLLIPNALFNKAFDDAYDKTGPNNEAHDSPKSLLVAQSMKQNDSPPASSLDYFVGKALQASSGSPYAVMNLGVLYSHLYQMCWESAAVVARADDDPYHAFDRFFAGSLMSSQADAAAAAEQRRLKRKSVLDFVQKDIARFSKKLGTLDRLKI